MARTWWDLPRTGSVEHCGDGLEARDELVELAQRQAVVRRCREIVGERLDPLFALPASVTEPAGGLDQAAGANCVNPPNGAQFYPFFSTRIDKGACSFQEGGPFLRGTKNDFGGSSKTEFGPLLQTLFPIAGFTTELRFENFNSGDMPNPCPVRGFG